jgi:hypothetical protein
MTGGFSPSLASSLADSEVNGKPLTDQQRKAYSAELRRIKAEQARLKSRGTGGAVSIRGQLTENQAMQIVNEQLKKEFYTKDGENFYIPTKEDFERTKFMRDEVKVKELGRPATVKERFKLASEDYFPKLVELSNVLRGTERPSSVQDKADIDVQRALSIGMPHSEIITNLRKDYPKQANELIKKYKLKIPKINLGPLPLPPPNLPNTQGKRMF